MNHNESETQRACYRWFSLQYPEYRGLLFSVPNGAHVSQVQARVLRAEGLTAGVSDMILLLPRNGKHGLMLEFKTPTGRQSEFQKEFQQKVERQGYQYEIVRTCMQFIELINAYVGVTTPTHEMQNLLHREERGKSVEK